MNTTICNGKLTLKNSLQAQYQPLNCIKKGEQDQGVCETWEPIQIPYYNCVQKKCIHLNPKPWEESKASLLELIGLSDSIMCILIAHIQKEFWRQNAHILFSPSPIGECLSQCHRVVDIAFDCVHSLWGFGWVLHLLLHFLELAFVGCGYENVQEHHTSL
jgi:hypothetical protein